MRIDFKNHVVAKAIMVIAIVGSSIVGNGISLAREKNKVDDYLFDTANDSSADLKDAAKQAKNLATVANRYSKMTQDDVNELSKLAKQLEDSKDVSEVYTLIDEIDETMNVVYNELLALSELTSDDERLAQNTIVDFRSDVNLIKNSDYNTLATSYNDLLDTFPSSFLKNINGADEVGIYQ